MKKIKLGDVVKDVITDFEGVVTARCSYITGCTHYGVTPIELKDGRPQDFVWLDEQRVVFVKKSALSKSAVPKGGPQSHPSMDNPPD